MSFSSTKVLIISRCKYKFENCVIDQCNNFHHLLYVVGGRGTLAANGVNYSMCKHDLFIIPPGTNHSMHSDLTQPLCTIEVKVLVNDPQLEAYMNLIALKIMVSNIKLKLILEAMLEEATFCRPQYKEIITANFIEFIMNLQRMRSNDNRYDGQPTPSDIESAQDLDISSISSGLLSGKTEFGDDLAGRTLRYIHENYERKITLKELAQQLAVNREHLCRVFFKRYNISPMRYLNNWRIHVTKELLASTEMSITEISANVGFHSVHYLSRRFAAKERISPLQYRQKVKDIIELKIEEKYDIVNRNIVMQR